MGNIISSTTPPPPPKECSKEDGEDWHLVDPEECQALEDQKELPQQEEDQDQEQEEDQDQEQEEEEEEEEEETGCTYIKLPPLPHPDYNPWPWSPGLPCPAEVEYWSCVNGVVLTEAELQAWERIAQEYGLKNEY